MPSKQPYNPNIYFILIIIILVWGISWPINKIGLQYMPPLWFATMRTFIGMITMFTVVITSGKLIFPKKNDLLLISIIGFLQIAIFMILINLGLQYVDASRSAILVYTTPIWVMPLAILFFHEKATHLKWIGFILGLSGILMMFTPWEINWSNSNELLGNGFLLLAALCWAISILCARNMKWSRTPFELISWQLLVGTIPIVIIASNQGPSFTTIQWNVTLIGCLLFSGIFSTALAYWGSIKISKELPSTTVSLSFLGVPVVGYICSIIILKEPITLTLIIAMIFILSGIVLTMLSGKQQAKKDKLRID
jgi:drug/metabolite transporter (DMT)-like permease